MSSTASPKAVVIGMDPHKRSVTIEVMAADEEVLDKARFNTDAAGFAAMLGFVARFEDRVWAIEGCAGIGRHVATRPITERERVVDVPARLPHRVRLLTSGNGRKTDDTDAHSIALVGVRVSGLRPIVNDAQVELLRVLVDRRRMLGEDHTRKISQLHRLLLELIPGGAKLYRSARQARKLLAPVRPRDAAGKAHKHLAMELVADLEKIYARSKAADKDLTAALKETGTTLTELYGIGPTGAAMLLSRSATSPGSRTATTSLPGPAPRRSMPPPVTWCATGSLVVGIVRSTGCCTSWPPSSYVTRPRAAPTSTGRRPPASRRWKPCAASNAACPTSSSRPCSRTSARRPGRVREGN